MWPVHYGTVPSPGPPQLFVVLSGNFEVSRLPVLCWSIVLLIPTGVPFPNLASCQLERLRSNLRFFVMRFSQIVPKWFARFERFRFTHTTRVARRYKLLRVARRA